MLQAELQQSVQGMDSQLNALEASLKASDRQIDSLQQELARSDVNDTVMKVGYESADFGNSRIAGPSCSHSPV